MLITVMGRRIQQYLANPFDSAGCISRINASVYFWGFVNSPDYTQGQNADALHVFSGLNQL